MHCYFRFLLTVSLVTCLGESAAHADAPAGRYVITGDGTTNGTVYDTKTKLTWQQNPPTTQRNWTDAKSYCTGLSLSGTGWRLPTVKELMTIVDFSRQSPAVDTAAFPGFVVGYFWSSSPTYFSTQMWLLRGSLGIASFAPPSDTYYARCVR